MGRGKHWKEAQGSQEALGYEGQKETLRHRSQSAAGPGLLSWAQGPVTGRWSEEERRVILGTSSRTLHGRGNRRVPRARGRGSLLPRTGISLLWSLAGCFTRCQGTECTRLQGLVKRILPGTSS